MLFSSPDCAPPWRWPWSRRRRTCDECGLFMRAALEQTGKCIWSPGDVLPDGVLGDRHHGDGRVRRKPVRLVVPEKESISKKSKLHCSIIKTFSSYFPPWSVVADVVEVAEEEGHGAEAVDAGASHAWKRKGKKRSWNGLKSLSFLQPDFYGWNCCSFCL